VCIRVEYACVKADCSEPYDADRKVITIPRCLPRRGKLLIVRAVLSELAVQQPALGARCFCGAPVQVAPRIPQQMRRRQVTHGA
jgi:hypothetical protein